MQQALELAQKAASEDEVPVGAVVILNGKIIGRGYNRREQDQSPIAHAEILAIEEAAKNLGSWRLEDCELIVTLEPCPMCLAACQQARIKQVFYGAQDPKGGALSLGYPLHEDLKTNHRFSVTFQETPECGKILSEFFQKKRKRK
jgi:tRNA(adenine34) deaminase